MMTRMCLWCAVLAFAGCSAGSDGPGAGTDTDATIQASDIPLGTFCTSVDGVEQCASADSIRATRSEVAGNVTFEVTAPFGSDDEYDVIGSMPIGGSTPRAANPGGFGIPLTGTCTALDYRNHGLNDWRCDSAERALYHCHVGANSVQILMLTPDEVVAVATGRATLPASCCENDSICDVGSGVVDPPGPFDVQARLHVAF